MKTASSFLLPSALALGVTLFPGAAHAQQATSLSATLRTVDPEKDPAYSDAVDVMPVLTRTDTEGPVVGATLEFYLRDTAGNMNAYVGSAVTDDEGRINPAMRIPLVNGCDFLGNATLTGGPLDAPVEYPLEVLFAGDTINGEPLAGSSTTVPIRLVKETVQVKIIAGTSGRVGEPLTIKATVEDLDGDAPCDRSAMTGDRAQTLVGRTLAFFLDYNSDGDFSDPPREFLGNDVTERDNADSDAYASVVADTTPQGGTPRAGVRDNALLVQLPANDPLYLAASGSSRLVLEPAALDPQKSTLTVEPEKPTAGSSVKIIATLRDAFGNEQGPDAAEHVVQIVVEEGGGRMVEAKATRDPETGRYFQFMEGPAQPSTVKVRLMVDGQSGSSLDIEFTSACGCRSTRSSGPEGAMAFLVAACALGARRRKTLC
ncbi:MAG: invasin domain 3-containing protein [Myxococcota bacterium]